MSLPLPTSSENYAVTGDHDISTELWNHVWGDAGGRLAAVEAIVAAGYTAAQEAGTAMAQAIIVDSVAPQIEDITDTIDAFNAQLALAEDQLAALQSGGVEATNIPVPNYGIYNSMNAQTAFYHVSDVLTLINDTALPALASGKLDKSAKADESTVDAGTNDATYITPFGLRARENKVGFNVGDMLITAKDEPGQPGTWLECNNGKYLKAAYPDLAEVCGGRFGQFGYVDAAGGNYSYTQRIGTCNGASYFGTYDNAYLSLYRITPDGVVTRVINSISTGQPGTSKMIANVGNRLIFLGSGNQIFRSLDNGLTWTHMASLPGTTHGIVALGGYFYIKVYVAANHSDNGVYRSATGDNSSWTRMWPLGAEDTNTNRNLFSDSNAELHVVGGRLLTHSHAHDGDASCQTIYSDDGGVTFTVVDTPYRDFFTGTGRQNCPLVGDELFRWVRNGPSGTGIYKSSDGLEWALVITDGAGGISANLALSTTPPVMLGSGEDDMLCFQASITGQALSSKVFLSTKGSKGRVWRIVYAQSSSTDSPLITCGPVGGVGAFVRRNSGFSPPSGPVCIVTPKENEATEFRVPAAASEMGTTFIKATA